MQPVSDVYRPLAAQYAAKDVSGAAGASGVGGNIDCVMLLLHSEHAPTILNHLRVKCPICEYSFRQITCSLYLVLWCAMHQ